MEQPTIIITGASRGLGEATARILARMGANVVLNARSEDDLERIAAEINEQGGSAVVAPGGISNPPACYSLVGKAFGTFGRLDAVINNAGMLEPVARLDNVDPDDWQRNWEINVLAVALLTKEAIPYLRENKGRVINVSSGAAVGVVQGWGAYSVAKAALNHYTRFLAAEEPDITSIAVRPGKVDTAMQQAIREQGGQGMTEKVHQAFIDNYEKGELLPPDQPGRALALLALHAPKEWSGEFISWDDERVEALSE